MDNPLEYIVYGKTTVDGAYTIMSHTAAAPLKQVRRWQEQLPLLPLSGQTEPETYAAALLYDDDTYILALALSQQAIPELPLYRYLVIPAFIMESIGNDVQLLGQIAETIEIANPTPIYLANSITWTAEKRVAILSNVLAQLDQNFGLLVRLLEAALHPDGLVIQHFPAQHPARLQLVQGITMLLPLPLRSLMTFTTHTNAIPEAHPRIVFSDAPAPAHEQVFDAKTQQLSQNIPLGAYPAYLLELWHDDMTQLVESLRLLDRIAVHSVNIGDAVALLPQLVQRHRLEIAIQQDALVEITTVLAALDSDYPPPGELRLPYLARLLRLALEERHSAAAERVAREMDADSRTDNLLQPILEQSLETQPDAVYAFVRPHLSETVSDHWLARLQMAAVRSLEVAISEGDSGTLSGWLRLIAREPAHYHLENVLRDGIKAALLRAAAEPSLAIELLMLAVRRAPDIVPMLMADAGLLAALPEPVNAALVNFDAVAIEALATTSRELFLLALHQVLNQQSGCTSVATAQLLWEIYQTPGNFPLGTYHPATIIRQILKTGIACLEDGALEVLVTAILADKEDALFYEVAPSLAGQGALQPVLATALDQSGRPNNDVMLLLDNLAANNVLSYRDQVDNYVALLLSRSRNGGTALLIEHLARILSQHPDVFVPSAVLWMMLDMAAETKSDLMLRVALKRLLLELNGVPSEAQMAESLLRLRRATTWSSLARTVILNWWREFAGIQPLVKLHKLEKIFDAKKGLEDMRGIVQTALAVRRLLGQKPLDEFARDIGITYRLLQALADGFDPEDNKPMSIDTDTLRTVMSRRSNELSPDVKQVLATNLRALAELIVSLSENRSKPTLLNRNDEALDRALMTGEHTLDGAVDVMKFLSGLLDGTGQHKPGE